MRRGTRRPGVRQPDVNNSPTMIIYTFWEIGNNVIC